MAERVGFEPTCPFGQDAFEAPPLRPLRYLSEAGNARGPTLKYTNSQQKRARPLSTSTLEERLHQLPALGFANAGDHLEPMIVSRQLATAHG